MVISNLAGNHRQGRSAGAGLRIEPVSAESLDDLDGRLVIPRSGLAIDDELVRSLRDAGRR